MCYVFLYQAIKLGTTLNENVVKPTADKVQCVLLVNSHHKVFIDDLGSPDQFTELINFKTTKTIKMATSLKKAKTKQFKKQYCMSVA